VNSTKLAGFCLAALGTFSAVGVFAQQTPAVPSTLQPGSAERQLNKPREPVPDTQQGVSIELQTQAPPPNADSLSFVLTSVDVTGASAIASSELTAHARAQTGKTVSVAWVYQAAAEMTARYRDAGYILSSVVVPQQRISGGHVTLQAVEGYVSDVHLEGDKGQRAGMLKKMSQRVMQDRPLHNATLERFMLLLNDLPGVAAQAVLQPSQVVSGASELIVRLRQSPASVSAAASNRGSKLQGPTQLQANAAANSLLGIFDETALQYLQAVPGDELRFYSLTHRERLTASGLQATVSASRSRSDTQLGEEFLENHLQTDSKQASVELAYPLVRTRALNFGLRGSFRYNDGRTDGVGTTLNHDILAAFAAGISVDITDSARGVNLLDLDFSHGVSAFGASRYGDPLASRPGGRPDFSKMTANLARLQSLGGPFSLLIGLNGQYAFSKVLIAEEYAYGGEYFGRAYDVSELVGDSGLAGKVELRYTLDTAAGFGMTLYGFGEDGKVWRRITTDVDTPRTDSAVSVGGGARFTFTRFLSGYVEAAKPTNHVVAAEGNQSARVFGGLQFNWVF
jgi:hemolysin activation/secretion protein